MLAAWSVVLSITCLVCLINFKNPSRGRLQEFFQYSLSVIKTLMILVGVMSVLLCIMISTGTPTLYPWSYMPYYHPLNTYPNTIGPYSTHPNQSRLIMKRKVFAGSSTNTILRARKSCNGEITDAGEGYYCLIQECSSPITNPIISVFLSNPEKDELCDGHNKKEYLFILGYEKPIYSC